MDNINKKQFLLQNSIIFVLLFLCSLVVLASDDENSWQQISISNSVNYIDENGVERLLSPSCSGGPVCQVDSQTGQISCEPGNTDYSFFLRKGDNDKLVIFFDGGGACWNANNCVNFPTYNPTVNETPEQLAQAGGIADFQNPKNPFKNWSMAFLPYCTGDVHWGSNDEAYVDAFGALGSPGSNATIHHRGFDNFQAVLQWLKSYYAEPKKFNKSKKPKKQKGLKDVEQLLVTGSSAGAYGAIMAFPYFREAMPKARANILSDAGSGVLSESFVIEALDSLTNVDTSTWQVRQNLPSWIPGMSDVFSLGANAYPVAIYNLIAGYYPDSHIGQYSTAWDLTQIGFLHISQNINDPSVWSSPTPNVVCEFNLRMRNFSYSVASSSSNYRYYIGAGTQHTVLANPDDPNLFYTEDSAGGIRFMDWLRGMIAEPSDDDDSKSGKWRNLECEDCEPLFDPLLCLG